MSNLAKNLDFLLYKHRLSANQLQDKSGITQSTTTRIISGATKSPRQNVIEQYAQFFKVSSQDLVYKDLTQEGQGQMTAPFDPTKLKGYHRIDDWDDDTPLDVDELEFVFYKDFGVACGHSSDGTAYDNEWRKLRMSRATIDRIGSHHDQIFATLADGDSMSPTINDGDTIWVDMSKQSIKDGKIFVFEYGGLYMCKRLYRLPNNGLRIVSDNADTYPDWQITGEQREQNGFNLIGWVWHWSVMERW